jgi:hypothetical protein
MQSRSCKSIDYLVKGSLKRHSAWWHHNVHNEYILGIIDKGYELPFLQLPKPDVIKNNKSALDNTEFVTAEIEKLVDTGILIKMSNTPTIINPLTVAENAAGKQRLVLDLRVVNPLLHVDKFKFEDVKVASNYFSRGCYMCSFDLKAGYHHIDISPSYQQYLGLRWCDQCYVFSSVPFGISSGGLVFSKVLKELVKLWRADSIQMVIYLDDGIIIADSFQQAQKDAARIKSDLEAAGFIINAEKSQWIPVQQLQWLGFKLDSAQNIFEIPADKLFRLKTAIFKTMIARNNMSARGLSKVVGKLTSMYHAFGSIVYIMTKACQCWIADKDSWSFRSQLTEACMFELRFWHKNVDTVRRQPLEKPQTRFSRLIFSDASASACGAFMKYHKGSEMIHHWTVEEKLRSSTWRELRAVDLFLEIHAKELSGLSVKWYTDNQAVPRILYKGSMVDNLQDLALNVFTCCLAFDIDLSIDWVPRDMNEAADELSKTPDLDDWSVQNRIFVYLSKLCGPFTIDCFASNLSHKLPRFFSKYWCQGTYGIDAFAYSWAGEFAWLVPPPSLITKVISHCKLCKAKGILIVPKWVASPFWPLLAAPGGWRPGISLVMEYVRPVNFFNRGPYGNSVFTEARFSSHVLILKLDFSCCTYFGHFVF